MLALDGIATVAEVYLNGERVVDYLTRCSNREGSTSAAGSARC